jgi:hypothetical protein
MNNSPIEKNSQLIGAGEGTQAEGGMFFGSSSLVLNSWLHSKLFENQSMNIR